MYNLRGLHMTRQIQYLAGGIQTLLNRKSKSLISSAAFFAILHLTF